MGMFDSVVCYCPNCCAKVYFQSKAGDCCGSEYDLDNVPAAIADDLDKIDKTCGACGENVRIQRKGTFYYVPMEVD